MKKLLLIVCVAGSLFFASPVLPVNALKKLTPTPTPSIVPSPTIEPTDVPVANLTRENKETLGPLEEALKNQKLGNIFPQNPLKYAIRSAVVSGVPANTIVLLLLLPVIASFVAAARHLVGVRGFGIFLPAALAVTFVATGPIIGIGLFLLIVSISTSARFALRKLKIKLQYLPRMAIILWLVSFGVLGILFLQPVIRWTNLSSVSIFPVLILTLLAEDFTRVQLGKSARVAVNLTSETLILSLISYLFLTLRPVQLFVLLNPEAVFAGILVFDLLLGRYTGLRFLEFWRFRRLIRE